jgi:hypothetical protein
MLQEAGQVGYYPKGLKGAVSTGCYTYRAFCLQGDLLIGRFVTGSSILAFLSLDSHHSHGPLHGLRLCRLLWPVYEL